MNASGKVDAYFALCHSKYGESSPKRLHGASIRCSFLRLACYSTSMGVRLQFRFRFAAVLLLLLTGAELFACEIIAPDRCESFGFPSDNPDSAGDDNCICCCAHILIASPIILGACGEAVAISDSPTPAPPESEPLSVYHPPKA